MSRRKATAADPAVLQQATAIAERAIAEATGHDRVRLSAANPAQTNPSETRWRGASRMLSSMASWVTRLGSAYTDTPAREQRTMQARSNDAYRNHLIARAIITRSRTNIVGTGLTAHPQVDVRALGISEEEGEELNELIAAEYETWADNPLECDAQATLDIYSQQSLALVSAMLQGDCFAATPFVERPGGLWGLKVRLIDGQRVSNPNRQPDRVGMVSGIEMAADGFPVACWVRRAYEDDPLNTAGANQWDRLPFFGGSTGRRRVMHIFNDKDRIDLVRGIPHLAPILEPLQTLTMYGRAELMTAVTSALITFFIERDQATLDDNGDPLDAFAGQYDANDPAGLADDDGESANLVGRTSVPERPTIDVGGGSVVELEPGAKSAMHNPARPSAQFDPFFIAVVKQIGAAVELPVDELLLHYQSSYSAARAAMLQAWRFYTMRRWWLVQQFCAPVRLLWFDEAVARGRIPVTNYADPARRAAYTRCLWVGPARGSMNEEQEAKAARSRIDGGMSNETLETAAMTGESWQVVALGRARELRFRKRHGLPIPESLLDDPNAAPTDPADPGNPDADPGANGDPIADLRSRTEAYSMGVRAGVITPQPEDEEAFRRDAQLPPMTEAVREAWDRDQGTRRPVTLKDSPSATPPPAPGALPFNPPADPDDPDADPGNEP